MTMEGGNGMEAGGSAPAGALVHPPAINAKPVEGRFSYCGRSRRGRDREGTAEGGIRRRGAAQAMPMATGLWLRRGSSD
jgi:hypothetical protein